MDDSQSEKVLLEIINCMTKELDDLITACYNSEGAIIAPSKKDIMRARSMLPLKCKNTLMK